MSSPGSGQRTKGCNAFYHHYLTVYGPKQSSSHLLHASGKWGLVTLLTLQVFEPSTKQSPGTIFTDRGDAIAGSKRWGIQLGELAQSAAPFNQSDHTPPDHEASGHQPNGF